MKQDTSQLNFLDRSMSASKKEATRRGIRGWRVVFPIFEYAQIEQTTFEPSACILAWLRAQPLYSDFHKRRPR